MDTSKLVYQFQAYAGSIVHTDCANTKHPNSPKKRTYIVIEEYLDHL